MVANSRPMGPAPMMMAFFGSSRSASASRAVSTRAPSAVTPGMRRARDPVATMMDLALTVCVPPSFSATATVVGEVSFALPHRTSMWLPFISDSTPFTSRAETLRLRSMAAP